MIVGDHPQAGRRDAGGSKPPHRLVEQSPADAVAVKVRIDVQRVDVPVVRVGDPAARSDVGEPDNTLAEPGHDHLAAVGAAQALPPHGELDGVRDRRDKGVGDGERPGVQRSDRLGVGGCRGIDDDGAGSGRSTDHLTASVPWSRPVV